MNKTIVKMREASGLFEQLICSNACSDSDGASRPFDVADWSPNPEAQCNTLQEDVNSLKQLQSGTTNADEVIFAQLLEPIETVDDVIEFDRKRSQRST